MGTYVATILDKHVLGDNTYIYKPKKSALGFFDEEKNKFVIDKKEYTLLTDPEFLENELDDVCAYLISLEDLANYFENNVSIEKILKIYEDFYKKTVFFKGINEYGSVYCVQLDEEEILAHIVDDYIDRGLSITEEDEEIYGIKTLNQTASDLVLGLSNGRYSKVQLDALKREFDLDSEMEAIEEWKYMFGEELAETSSILISEIITGKYSEEELNEMLMFLNNSKEIHDDLIESIYLQIDGIRSTIEDGEKHYLGREEFDKKYAELIEEEYEKQGIEKEELKKINIEEIWNNVTNTLIAQDEPARRVITEIVRKEMDPRKKKEAILLTGPTGVGKTELMRLIAKYIDRPFIKVDATQLTIPGYVGKDIEEVLWDLYEKCDKNIEKVEQAIIFFDEIDKKGSTKKDDISGKGVLNVLLPFIEGATYDACADMKTAKTKVKINTANMTVVLGGAYTDVYKNLLENNTIGFNNDISSEKKYREATTKDFVEYGMMTDEFMGRVTVVKLNDLDVEAIKRVMLESDESAIKIQQKIFEELGVKLTFTDGFATEVAKRAEEKKTGARGLNGIIDEATWQAFAKVHSNPDKYKEVILNEETVEDSSCYKLVKVKKD